MALEIIKNKIKQWIPEGLWSSLRNVYYNLPYFYVFFDIKFVLKRFSNWRKHRAILFYPEKPIPFHEIFTLCHLLGYKKVDDLCARYDVAFHWHDTTFTNCDDKLMQLGQRMKVVNIRCRDISKKKVDTVFKELFGYSAMIDPLAFSGPCLKKSDLNSRHAESIVQCPLKIVERNFVYQKLINNTINNKFIQDIALPIFNRNIPFVYLRCRPFDKRFQVFSSMVQITELEKVVSQGEVEKILFFCRKMGLDYGEIEIIRDADDKKIYILDANKTPVFPLGSISFSHHVTALKKIAAQFERFLLEEKEI